MKIVRISALRQVDRNQYMSVWSAQRKGYIKIYYDDAGHRCYDVAEYQKWHKTCHCGRRSKFRPITEYKISELLKMDYFDVLKKNQDSTIPYTKASVEELLSAIIHLKKETDNE